jgi:quinol monooxygenase YgiN
MTHTGDKKILRIVRMTFRSEALEAFLDNFDKIQPRVRRAEGCESVVLLQDADNPCVVSTLSIWASAGHLNAYRKSVLFGEVWPQTKSGFAHPPRAESYFWDPSLGFPS